MAAHKDRDGVGESWHRGKPARTRLKLRLQAIATFASVVSAGATCAGVYVAWQVSDLATDIAVQQGVRAELESNQCNSSDDISVRYAIAGIGGYQSGESMILELLPKQSSEVAGRVDIDVAVKRERLDQGIYLEVVGAYGHPSVHDEVLWPADRQALEAGECGSWAQFHEASASSNVIDTFTFEGLWAGRTYCFAPFVGVGEAYPFPAENQAVEPRCIDVTWNPDWGPWYQPPPATSFGSSEESE